MRTWAGWSLLVVLAASVGAAAPVLSGAWRLKPGAVHDSIGVNYGPRSWPLFMDANEPSLAVSGPTVFAAWHESNWCRVEPNPNLQDDPWPVDGVCDPLRVIVQPVYVQRFDNGHWTFVGSNLNTGQSDAYFPRIAVLAGAPVVAYLQNDAPAGALNRIGLYVRRWTGSMWIAIGGGPLPLARGSDFPINLLDQHQLVDIAAQDGLIYVAYVEREAFSRYRLRVKFWSGAGWIAVGGPINVDPMRLPEEPRLRFFSGSPHLAWREGGALFVKRVPAPVVINFGPPFGPQSVWSVAGAGDLRIDGGQTVALSLGGTASPLLAWAETDAATMWSGLRPLTCTRVYALYWDNARGWQQLANVPSQLGSTGEIAASCADISPRDVDVDITSNPTSGEPFAIVTANERNAGGPVATATWARVFRFTTSSPFGAGWQRVGGDVEAAKDSRLFHAAALRFADGRPVAAYVRREWVDPLRQPTPTPLLFVEAFE